MKVKKNNHEHPIPGKLFKHVPDTLRQYAEKAYESLKYKKMSQGSANIFKTVTSARKENWRQNHPKSLNKKKH